MKNIKYIKNSVQNTKNHAKCILWKGKLFIRKEKIKKNLAFSQLYNNIKQYLERFPGVITPFPCPIYTS